MPRTTPLKLEIVTSSSSKAVRRSLLKYARHVGLLCAPAHHPQASRPITTMFAKSIATPLLALSSLALQVDAVSKKQWSKRAEHVYLPKETSDYQTATAPNNVTIRYKNPGICETTPGVDSYSGYVDLAPNVSPSHNDQPPKR
jgi:hypothetical protein